MQEVIHIHESFDGPEEFRKWEQEHASRMWSPSRVGTLAACPRKYQYRYVDRLREKDKPIMLSTGSIMHIGLHRLLTTGDPEQAIEAMREKWTDPGPLKPEDEHLSLAHLEIIVKNYHDFWQRHSSYKPYLIKYEDLDKSNLMAARWIMTDDGNLVLGESTMLMRFETETGEPLYIKGIPDDIFLTPSGNLYVVDHKTTGGWISDYWRMKYRVSDQFRIYALMIRELLGRPVHGVVLDAVYTGKYATNTKSKAVKFDRAEYIFDDSVLKESLKNVQSLVLDEAAYREREYFPQNTGLYCGGCTFLDTHCKQPDWARDDMTGLIQETSHHSMLDPRDD